MKIAFPILEDQGLQSELSAHFGSAPNFLVFNTVDNTLQTLANGNLHHAHGQCQPLQALAGAHPEVVICGGMGMGALMRLEEAGIHVYRGEAGTVAGALAQFQAGQLQRLTVECACGHHHGGHACGHSH